MLFWLSVLSFVAGLVLTLNGATWFESEDKVTGIAVILGVVLMAKQSEKMRKSMLGMGSGSSFFDRP